MAALLAGLAAGTAAQDEAPLKAAIVFNLLQFVEWPGEAPRPPGSSLTLCADRRGALWPNLSALQARPLRGGLVLTLRELPESAEGLRHCQAWVAETTPASRRLSPQAALANGVLVVADTERADEPGVVVGLRLAGDRVGFDIDLAAARRAGLQVSSKLLRLAGKVHE